MCVAKLDKPVQHVAGINWFRLCLVGENTMKTTVSMLVLVLALSAQRISIGPFGSGGAVAPVPCTGEQATMLCGSNTPNVNCDNGIKYKSTDAPEDQNWVNNGTTVTCQEKNPNTDCTGSGSGGGKHGCTEGH